MIVREHFNIITILVRNNDDKICLIDVVCVKCLFIFCKYSNFIGLRILLEVVEYFLALVTQSSITFCQKFWTIYFYTNIFPTKAADKKAK